MSFSDTIQGSSSRKSAPIALAIFGFLILVLPLQYGDLSGYDDALYAHQAKEMVLSGDWWNVRFNARLNFEFPPMFMWLEALSMQLLGFTDFAAKFPVALLGIATIILTYLLALEMTGDEWLALLAMIVLLSTQYFIKYAMHAMTDVPCTFFFLLSVFAYVKGLRNPRYFLLCGIATGLTILTRSVVGLLPPVIFLSHLLVTRRYSAMKSWQALTGLLLAVAVPSIWYVSQYVLHGDAFIAAHLDFTGSKILSARMATGDRILGLLEYPKLLLQNYWPWLPFLALGVVRQGRRLASRDSSATLLLLWVAWVVAPFSIADVKVLRYIMPALPAFAVISATSLYDFLPAGRRRRFLQCVYAVGIAGVLYLSSFPPYLSRAGDMKQLGPIAEANSPRDQNIYLYTWGRTEYGYNNQLLWYADRYTELPRVLEGVRAGFQIGDHTVAIMDRDSYETFAETLKTEFRVEVLGRSELFVCFKATRPG